MIKNFRKKSIIVLTIIIVAIAWFVHKKHQLPMSQEATLVETVKVTAVTIPLEANVVGSVVAAKNVQIAPETSGQVAKILFQDGMFVKQGTPLIQLDDAIFATKNNSAHADLNLSQTTFHRMTLLAKKGIISQQDIAKAAADLEEKKAAALESQVMLNKMLLVAPFDGVVGKCLVSPGDYVSVGQALVPLTDTHHLHVEYKIAEKHVAKLKLNQDVKVTSSAFPEKEFLGKVAYIAPTINTQDRTISVYAEVPDNQALVAGLFVNVSQALGSQTHALTVPTMSLMATIDGEQIYKVVDNKIQAIPVVVGQRMNNSVQIIKGLEVGEVVVITGQQKIRDGSTVTIKD